MMLMETEMTNQIGTALLMIQPALLKAIYT